MLPAPSADARRIKVRLSNDAEGSALVVVLFEAVSSFFIGADKSWGATNTRGDEVFSQRLRRYDLG
jgi:hypothetical protein